LKKNAARLSLLLISIVPYYSPIYILTLTALLAMGHVISIFNLHYAVVKKRFFYVFNGQSRPASCHISQVLAASDNCSIVNVE